MATAMKPLVNAYVHACDHAPRWTLIVGGTAVTAGLLLRFVVDLAALGGIVALVGLVSVLMGVAYGAGEARLCTAPTDEETESSAA